MPQKKIYPTPAARQAAHRRRRAEQLANLKPPLDAEPVNLSIPQAPHARWLKLQLAALQYLQQVVQERQIYFDARSEGWQESDRGQEFSEITDHLEEIAEMNREINQ